MKIGRNDPCPCGSGKKYKKCCYVAKAGSVAEADSRAAQTNNNAASDSGHQPLLNFFKDTETGKLEEVINALRMLALKTKPHIKAYYKIRKMHDEITDTMSDYYDSGKFKRTADGSLPSDTHDDSATQWLT